MQYRTYNVSTDEKSLYKYTLGTPIFQSIS